MEDRYSFAKKYDLQEDHVVDVSSGVCPLGPSKKVKAAVRREVKHISRDPDGGCGRLKRYFSARCGLPEDALCCAASLRDLLRCIVAAVQPKKVLLPGPAPPLYDEIVRAAGAEVFFLPPGDGFSPDVKLIRERLKGMDLVVMANPNRVTGRVTGPDQIRESLSAASGGNTVFVVDESLMDFADGSNSLWNGLPGNNLVVLRTTAYFYGLPGLELAYAAAPAPIAEAVQKMRSASPGGLAVEAALSAFRDTAYRKAVLNFVDREKEWLMRSLRKIGGISCIESDTNVFLLRLERSAEAVMHSLCRAGFLIRDCSDINGIDPSFLRCSLLKHEKAVKFVKLLKGGLQQIRIAD